MTVTSNFDNAVTAYSNAANTRFTTVGPTPATPESEAEHLTAFTQLSGAAQLQFEQRNRAGFDAVVDLMKTTAETADTITAKLVALYAAAPPAAGAPATNYQLISALNNTLDVLARLSPSTVWTKPGASTKSG